MEYNFALSLLKDDLGQVVDCHSLVWLLETQFAI